MRSRTMPHRVRVGLAHLAPLRGDLVGNRERLFAAVEQAALDGAELVLAPELATSGYGFRNSDEARPLAEPLYGPTLLMLERLCGTLGIWCATGFLETDESPATGTSRTEAPLYNSAMLVGPEGLVGHHRKIVTEHRWMTPGNACAPRPFNTPWGPLGLLVCADTYYSAPARALALRGAQAVVVLAAWPRIGMDPQRIWRARAAENGVPLFVANRTGKQRRFDSRTATSAIYDARGELLFERFADAPFVEVVDVPLLNGHWPARHGALVGHKTLPFYAKEIRPFRSRAAGHGGRGARVRLLPGETALRQTGKTVAKSPTTAAGEKAPADVVVCAPPSCAATTELAITLGQHTDGASSGDTDTTASPLVFGADPDGVFAVTDGHVHRPHLEGVPLVAHCGEFTVAAVTHRAAQHPEVYVALAEAGVDLAVVCAPPLSPPDVDRLLLGSLERLAVAVVTPEGAWCAVPPEGHEAPALTSSATALTLDLPGRWSSVTGGTWDIGHAVDREVM